MNVVAFPRVVKRLNARYELVFGSTFTHISQTFSSAVPSPGCGPPQEAASGGALRGSRLGATGIGAEVNLVIL